MKKIFLLCFLTVSVIFAKESVEFNYANSDMERKTPTSKEYLLSYSNILKSVNDSVVNISTEKSVTNKLDSGINELMANPFFREFFKGYKYAPQDRVQRSLGSGVIITEDGYIVTNNHVVDGADTIKVTIGGSKKEYKARLIGKDKKSDLAIIKIDAKNLNAITFYDSDKVEIGDIVFAIGNPFGVGETITQGIVSATGRSDVGITEYENFIQTDASINPGNSGGALINSAGQLIGINAAIISKSGGNVGIGFAIPSNMVTSIAKQLIEEGKYTRAYLGVNIADVTSEMSSFYNDNFGALITSVDENAPAAEAGLKRGDLIIAVNGKKISSASELKNVIGSYPPSRVINVKFLRDKKIDIVNVKLGSLDEKLNISHYQYKGMTLQPLNAEMKAKLNIPVKINGLIVSKIELNDDTRDSGIMEVMLSYRLKT